MVYKQWKTLLGLRGSAGTRAQRERVGAGGHLLTDASQAMDCGRVGGEDTVPVRFPGITPSTGEVENASCLSDPGEHGDYVIDIGTRRIRTRIPVRCDRRAQKYLDRGPLAKNSPDDMVIIASEECLRTPNEYLPGHSPDQSQRWQWSYQSQLLACLLARARPKNQPGFGPWNYYDGSRAIVSTDRSIS